MPHRRRTESRTSFRRLQSKQAAIAALEMVTAGATYEQVATSVKVKNEDGTERLAWKDRSGAYRAVIALLKALPEPQVTEYRKLNIKRLNAMRLRLWPHITKGDTGAMKRELDIQEREARYLGLDAPTRQEVTGAGGGPLLTQIIVADQETKAGIERLLHGERTEPSDSANPPPVDEKRGLSPVSDGA